MKKQIISFLLIFSILFSSFSVSVSAQDNPNWVSVDEELLNELYYLVSCAGCVFSPDISLYDVLSTLSTSSTAGMFRLNPETLALEIDSTFRYDYGDKVTYPAETTNIIKSMLADYPQTKSSNSSYLEYSPIEQNGQIFYPKGTIYKGFINKNYPNREYSYEMNTVETSHYSITKIDTSKFRFFGVLSEVNGTNKIEFYRIRLSDNSSFTSLLSYKEIAIDVTNLQKYETKSGSQYHEKCQSWSFNFPLFNSVSEGAEWANSGNDSNVVNNSYNTNYYLSQKFNQSFDNSVTITKDMLTQNFQEINNNYYNNVYNYVSNYVNENDSNPDTSALQAKIEEMQSSLDQILQELQNSSGGGSGEGGSGEGGSSSGDSSQDYTKDLEVIKTSLSDIYKKLEEFYEKYKNTVDSETKIDLSNIERSLSDLNKLLTDFSQDNLLALQDMYKRLDDILIELKNAPNQIDYSTNFDNLEQILADIQLLLTSDSELYHSSLSHIEVMLEENNKQNKNFFDKVLVKLDDIITFLKKIYRVNVVDTIADIVSAITDLFDFASLAQRSSETANLVKTKFPFCMPFDLFATLGVLSAPAVIPHFDLPFNFNIFGKQTENIISIDLTQYEKLATFSRDAFTVLFVVGLIMLTIKVFHGGDDDD